MSLMLAVRQCVTITGPELREPQVMTWSPRAPSQSECLIMQKHVITSIRVWSIASGVAAGTSHTPIQPWENIWQVMWSKTEIIRALYPLSVVFHSIDNNNYPHQSVNQSCNEDLRRFFLDNAPSAKDSYRERKIYSPPLYNRFFS